MRSAIDPGLDQCPGQLLIARRGFATLSGIPAPGHQVILGNMLLQRCKVAAAIAVFIFQLSADFAECFSFPAHRQRCELPARISRDALIARGFVQREIAFGMAHRATRARNPRTGLAAPYWRRMLAMFSALKRVVSGWMTVHASWIGENFSDLGEDRA